MNGHFYQALYSSNKMSSTVGLNLQFFRHMNLILKIIFSGPDSVLSVYLFLLLVSVVYQITAYYLGITTSKFYSALTDKDGLAFQNLVVALSALILVIAVAKSIMNALSGYFTLKCRKSLVHAIHSEYISFRKLYYCVYQNVDLDNPDQRITQDVDKLSRSMALILQQTAISPFLAIYYAYQTSLVGGWISPLILFGYFLTSCLVTRMIISPISKLVFVKEQSEGDFRHLHVRLEMHAESIAMHKGEEKERKELNSIFDQVLLLQRKIVNWQMLLAFLTNFIDYFGTIVCYSIIGIPIITNNGEMGELISKTLFVSMSLLNILTTIVDLGDQFADMTGYVARIGQFLDCFDVYFHYHFTPMALDVLKVQDISFSSHASSCAPIISNLSFTVTPQSHLMIQGPSGIGKSTLVKILSDLWPPLSGTLQIPSSTFFLPQNPYLLCAGSLREQICYPEDPDDSLLLDSRYEQVLQEAEIHHLRVFDGLVKTKETSLLSQDWTLNLSAGERQRIAFARLLYRVPKFAILDEATIHMSRDMESRLLTRAIQKGITFIVVSHYPLPCLEPCQILSLENYKV